MNFAQKIHEMFHNDPDRAATLLLVMEMEIDRRVEEKIREQKARESRRD